MKVNVKEKCNNCIATAPAPNVNKVNPLKRETLKSNSKQHQMQEKENVKNFSFVENHKRNVKLHGECLMLF